MKKRLLIEIHNMEQAQYFIENKMGSLLLSVMGVSQTKEFNTYLNELSFLSELALAHDVELIINLDMLYHEDDLIGLKAILKRLHKLNISKLMICDVGVIALANELELSFSFINGSSTLNTNYASIKSVENIYDGFFVSNEININEIEKISNLVNKDLVVQLFGKQKIFTSKRKLLTAYVEYTNIKLNDFHPRKKFMISDKNAKDNFSYIYEDNNGTYVYTQNNVLGLQYIDKLTSNNIRYLYLSNIFTNEKEYTEIVEIFNKYILHELNLDEAISNVKKVCDNLSSSFFEDKTVFELNEIKSLEMECKDE